MTHEDLQRRVLNECKRLGLWTLTIPDSRLVKSGWVDVVILGPGGALFAELKSEDGRRTLEQIKVATHLSQAGLSYRLWRPSDLDGGIIVKELEALR